jgi:hypothetical protein
MRPADWDDHYEWPFVRARRLIMKILGDPNLAVRALGLDIELPNPDADDRVYWERIHAEGWKPKLRGKVADPWEEGGDPDWALLLKPHWGRIWFDLEEGLIVYFQVENLGHAVDLLGTLSTAGVPLVWEDGAPRVWVSPCELMDPAAEIEPALRAAGFVPDPRGLRWTPHWLQPLGSGQAH